MKKNGKLKKVVSHLKGDMAMFKKEGKEDKKLISKIKGKKKEKEESPKHERKEKSKVKRVMKEFSAGTLKSGSKKGPVVKKKDQAIAIALSEAKRAKKKKK